MPKAYVSSTCDDLEGCRDATDRSTRSLRDDAIAMEDYGASDRRPFDGCSMDVAWFDGYVENFARPDRSDSEESDTDNRQLPGRIERGPDG
jgi:hypothetical protein